MVDSDFGWACIIVDGVLGFEMCELKLFLELFKFLLYLFLFRHDDMNMLIHKLRLFKQSLIIRFKKFITGRQAQQLLFLPNILI